METIEKRIEREPALAHAVTESVPAVGGGRRAPTKHEKGKRMEELDRITQPRAPGGRFAGVGDSKPFVAEPGTFDEAHDWSQLTLNGQPIPEHLWAQLPYAMTDQGTEEYNRGKQSRTVEVLREAPLSSRSTDDLTRFKSEQSIDKSVEQYRESMELMKEEDPLGVIMERHLPIGRRGLWMSEAKCDKEGMRRDLLDYEPLLDANGKRIVHGKMFLASVPEEMALAAEQIAAKNARDDSKAAIEKVTANAERVMSEAGLKRQNRRGDLPDGGIEFLEPDGGMIPGTYGRQFEG